jgi:hypothetical protein
MTTTLTPACRSLALMQKNVVRPVGAYHQIFRAVVLLVAVEVMNLFGAAQVSAQGTFGYENVFVNVAAARMALDQPLTVAVCYARSPAPKRVAFLGPELLSMTLPKTHRLALNTSPPWIILFGNRRQLPASTFAIHSALLVSAEHTNNLPLGGTRVQIFE